MSKFNNILKDFAERIAQPSERLSDEEFKDWLKNISPEFNEEKFNEWLKSEEDKQL